MKMTILLLNRLIFFTNGHLTNTAMFLAKLFWHRKDQCSLEYAR